MDFVSNKLVQAYNFLFVELADPRVESFPLMGTVLPLICILGFYIYFVFKLGPWFMRDRPAFNIDKILLVYNLMQIGLCSYITYQGAVTTLFTYNIFCEPVDYSYNDLAVKVTNHVWVYFMIKVFDLLDTIFFVLRKKNNQISFLHVYHHAGMCVIGWFGVKYLAGGHVVFIGIINSVVHIVMYFYYFLTALDKRYKNNVWWKKHITQMQIIQFCIILVYYLQILFQPNCKFPKWTVFAFVPQNIFMLALFGQFYYKQYVLPERRNMKCQ